MPHDPLDALVRVRRIALDEARRVLAACRDTEDFAAAARTQAEAAIARERDAAERLDAGDAAVEAFAAWLPTARERLRRTVNTYERTTADTARARAAVSVARGAHEAAEEALTRKRETDRLARQRHEQLGLDEAAARAAKTMTRVSSSG